MLTMVSDASFDYAEVRRDAPAVIGRERKTSA